VAYFRELWLDTRRTVGGDTSLLAIAVTASLAFVVGRYLPPTIRVPAFWTVAKNYALAGAAYGLIPALTLALLRRRPSEAGVALGRTGTWLPDIALAYVLMLPLLYVASRQPAFRQVYPYFAFERDGVGWLLTGLGLRFFGMLTWEFIFRGYLLFGIERRAGPGVALAATTIPFVILHFGKPMPELLGSIVAGLALGLIALRARSFLPCALLHFAVAATLDVLALAA
jgi:membrane protease YdiL (CAAX protease family)